jgi:hypothetical protein
MFWQKSVTVKNQNKMKKLIYLLLVSSICYAQSTTVHFFYGSSQIAGGEMTFNLRGTESSYLGGGFSGALNQRKADGTVAYGNINESELQYATKSIDEEWCSIYAIGGNRFIKKLLIKYKGGLSVYNKKTTFDNGDIIYNKIDKVLYKPLIGVGAMYEINKDFGIEIGIDTFNKFTGGFAVLF